MKGLEVIGATLGKYGFSRHIIAALKFFLRNPYETLIVTNADGRIEFLDRGSEKFFGLAQGEAKDLHIRELFPESSIPATLETRIPIVGRIFEIEDKKGVGSVYPLLENDKILGAVATLTFYSLEEVDRINSELGRLRRKVRYFEEKQRSEHAAIYSFGNILAIARQRPTATRVAGIRTWNELGRFVKKGEKGIQILAPIVGHRRRKDAADEEQSASQEAKPTPILIGFRAVYVFDHSQTEGADLPEFEHSITGEVGDQRERLIAFLDEQNIKL